MPHCDKKMISFFLTTKCNLCCRYCYNYQEREKKNEISLNVDIAKAGIDWYFSNYPYRHIRFYGPGEPTQEFQLMKQIAEYAVKKNRSNKKVTIELQTNGIFTEEIRSWILHNASIVWLSFDGMPDIQDYYRPINPKYSRLYVERNSSTILEENARWLIENGKKENNGIMIGARATITEANNNRQCEMVDYFNDLGIRYIWTDPVFHEVKETPVCKDPARVSTQLLDLEEYIDSFVQAYEYARHKDMFYGCFYMANFDGVSEYNCRCCTPLEAPHITPDGFVSACDMVTLGKKPYHMSPLVVGKWSKKRQEFVFYSQKIAALNNRRSTTIPHCQECIAKLHCGGYCIGETLNDTGDINGYVEEKCAAIVKLFKTIGSCDSFDYLHP